MDNIREQILSYPQLSPEDQQAVDTYVERHPEWASLLRDVRHIESLLHEPTASYSLLAAYVVAQRVGMTNPSPTLREEFARLEQLLETDDELQAEAEEIHTRLEATEVELDPVSHFESLTGHSLSRTEPLSPSNGPSSGQVLDSNASSSPPAWKQLIDEFSALPLVVRGIGTFLIVLLTGYMGLFAVDRATQSPLDRVASVEVSNQMIESYYSSQTRGASTTTDTASVENLYLRSLSTLRNAESSTLGLFHSYNPDSLRQAENGLNRVLSRTEPRSFLSLEAHFYLGKSCLARKQIDKARAHFQTVVTHDGRRAPDARQILQKLEELERDMSSETNS